MPAVSRGWTAPNLTVDAPRATHRGRSSSTRGWEGRRAAFRCSLAARRAGRLAVFSAVLGSLGRCTRVVRASRVSHDAFGDKRGLKRGRMQQRTSSLAPVLWIGSSARSKEDSSWRISVACARRFSSSVASSAGHATMSYPIAFIILCRSSRSVSIDVLSVHGRVWRIVGPLTSLHHPSVHYAACCCRFGGCGRRQSPKREETAAPARAAGEELS